MPKFSANLGFLWQELALCDAVHAAAAAGFDAVEFHWPYAVPGRGSAIFIHQWRRPHYPTEGCIALSREDLRWIAPRIRYETRLIV